MWLRWMKYLMQGTMKLDRITQYKIKPEQIEDVDLVIACCGYEKRAVSLLDYYGNEIQRIPNKYAIVYDSPVCNEIGENESLFRRYDFSLVSVSPQESFASIKKIIEGFFMVVQGKDNCRVLIDYSSMNREWYSAILLYLEHYIPNIQSNIDCIFYYSIPKFDGQKDKQYAYFSVKPLEGYTSFLMPDKPLSLFIGLGSEERALNGIRQYADVAPSYVHYFYTNNEHIFSPSNTYKSMFEDIDESNKHAYDLQKMIPIFNTMSDLYKMLCQKYRVAVISCGPKPFTLLSLIFARIFHVDVWKLETNTASHIVNKHPSGEDVTFRFLYKSHL